MPDNELSDKTKIDLLEKEIDALEMSNRQLKKVNGDLQKNLEQYAEENQRLLDMVFSQMTLVQDLQRRYKPTITIKRKSFLEWLKGK